MTTGKHREILFFLIVLGCVNGIVARYISGEFIWFAVTGFTLAALSPPLGRDEVDFWYYTLGIIGLVLLFYSQDSLRVELEAQQHAKRLRSDIGTLEALDKSLVRSLTDESKGTVLPQLALRFQTAATFYREQSYGCRKEGPQRTPRCTKHTKYRDIARELSEEDTLMERIVTHEYKLIEGILSGRRDIRLDHILLPAVLVAGVLLPNHQDIAVKELQAYLRDEIRDLREQLAEGAEKSANSTASSSGLQARPAKNADDLPLTLNLFLLTAWPYVLCTALCLKLARLGLRHLATKTLRTMDRDN